MREAHPAPAMPTPSETIDPPEPPVDRLRLGLAICSAASLVPLAILGYRLLLGWPVAVTIYLAATGYIGHDFARAHSTLAWSLRLLAALGVTWILATVLVEFLYTSSSGDDTDVFLFLVPAVFVFAAVVYRAPFLPARAWPRHLTALLGTVLATALWYVSVGAALF